MSRSSIRGAVPAFLLVCAVAAFAAKDFVMPRSYSAKTYPARDEHANEHVTVAADPYDTGDKTAETFVSDYRQHDLLPVLIVVTNDGDQPVSLNSLKVELVTVNRVKLHPATDDDLYRHLAVSPKRPDGPRISPIPLPRRAPRPALSRQVQDEVDRAPFKARAVEAHATQQGFFFFDVEGLSNPLAGARLYVNGVKSDGKELWYFEIPMEKYLTYQPGKK